MRRTNSRHLAAGTVLAAVLLASTSCSGASSSGTTSEMNTMPGMPGMPGMPAMPGMDGGGAGASTSGAAAGSADSVPSTMVVLPSHVPDSPGARRRAAAFLARVTAAVREEPWGSARALHRAGFRQLDDVHWYNRANLSDDVQFDPRRPEFVVVDGGRPVGEMFVPPSFSLHAPEPPGAPAMRWHYHRYASPVCTTPYLTQYARPADGCRAGDRATLRSPLMTHVWVGPGLAPFSAMMTPGGGS